MHQKDLHFARAKLHQVVPINPHQNTEELQQVRFMCMAGKIDPRRNQASLISSVGFHG